MAEITPGHHESINLFDNFSPPLGIKHLIEITTLSLSVNVYVNALPLHNWYFSDWQGKKYHCFGWQNHWTQVREYWLPVALSDALSAYVHQLYQGSTYYPAYLSYTPVG